MKTIRIYALLALMMAAYVFFLIFAAVKRILYIGLLLLVGMLGTCCKHETLPTPEEDMLYRVECFYQQNPDSAMQILDTLNVEALSEKERAHYCLLRARVYDRNNKSGAVTDSLLQVAENYFAGGKDKYFEAVTYFALARQYSLDGKGKQAILDCRLKALQSIGQCRNVDERLVRYSLIPTDEQNEIDRIKYAIHQRLGMSYAGAGYYREGVDHLKKADGYYAKKQNYRSRTVTAFPLGMSYLLLNEYDSCLMYYQIGLHSAEAMGDTIEVAYFHNALAEYCLYRMEAQHDENEEEGPALLHQAVAECHSGLSDLHTINEPRANSYRYSLISNLSHVYFDLQQYDSCIHYGRMAEEMAGGNRDLAILYKHLYNSYKALGDNANAASYADKWLETGIDKGSEEKAVAEVKAEYDKQLEIQRLESEQQLRRYRLYLWIALLAIVLLVVILTAFHYRKNKELEMLKYQEAQHQLQSELEKLTAQQKEMLVQQTRTIYKTGQKDRLERIMEAFKAAYPKACENMKTAYPELSKTERKLVVLSFLGFRIKEEADLLDLSENTVAKYRSNLKNKADFDPFFTPLN